MVTDAVQFIPETPPEVRQAEAALSAAAPPTLHGARAWQPAACRRCQPGLRMQVVDTSP